MTELPTDRRYTKDHEWARREGDLVVVGITHHAVEQLGDITLVTLNEIGSRIERGSAFGDVDSVKAVSELYAPVDGEIVDHNSDLENAPETINSDPYGEGWMVKLRASDPTHLDALMDATQYAAFLAED